VGAGLLHPSFGAGAFGLAAAYEGDEDLQGMGGGELSYLFSVWD
jgi:hypothetical protein